jgi:hypothetical protein
VIKTIESIKSVDNSRILIMLSENMDNKSKPAEDISSWVLEKDNFLSNDLGEEEYDLETVDILNLTLAEIKKE